MSAPHHPPSSRSARRCGARLALSALVVACWPALSVQAASGGGQRGATTQVARAPAPVAAPAPAPAAVATVAGEVLVVLKRADAVGALQTRHGLSITGRFGARPIFRLRVVGGGDTQAILTALQTEPDVLLAEPNYRHASPESVKNNVWLVGSAQAYTAQWAGGAIGLDLARGQADGRGVRVAVLDTGFDLTHPALAGRWLPGWDFVDGDADPSDTAQASQAGHGHGTHVAGLVAWVAPGASLLPLRVLDSDGQGNAWVLAEAVLHALDPDHNPATADGAQVINLSLAGLQRTRLMATVAQLAGCGTGDATAPAVALTDPGYETDRDRCALTGGAAVVVSAGNDGSSSLRTYPAAESAYGLLSVGASAANGRVASFSNSGGWIQLAAPGDGITSTVPGGGYGTWAGTSMAAPLVSGSAALVMQRYPRLPARDVTRCLEASTRPLSNTKLRQLNVGEALAQLAVSPRNCR